MASCKDVASFSLLERSSLIPASSSIFHHGKQRMLCFASPALKQGTLSSRSMRALRAPIMATISEEVAKLVLRNPVKSEKIKVRAAVTVRRKAKEDLRETIAGHLDALSDKIGRNVMLELISTEIDPRTKSAKSSGEAAIKDWFEKRNTKGEHVVYTVDFMVDSSFGVPGAVTVANRHQREFFLECIAVEGFACGPVHFPCNSWVQAARDLPSKRVFFSNKPYLPSETPAGLKELREKELKELRGDGKGIRKHSDRIYDYATYNDLGNPDKGPEFARPVLGGEKIPYPRRCRTGRPPTDTDLFSESRIDKPHRIYVPRDEAFEELKQDAFSTGRLKAVLHSLIPSLIASISADKHNFQSFHDIDKLYKEGLLLKMGIQDHLFQKVPLVRKIQESSHGLLLYDTPSILSKDKFAWLRDDEFARQTMAGINPVNIERILVFPPVSELDPAVFGPPESAITEDHIVGQLNGLTVEQAIDKEKLFMLDHHDMYLPFIDEINTMEGRKAYATRTIFFLTPLGTLKPVAIELSLPPAVPGGSRSSQVLTPPCDATTSWLWQLAKAHVCSNDSGIHQLVNHWMRTHAFLEPVILALHRQLSALHPVHKFLRPHTRYTLEINAIARQGLLNADGVIESCFAPGPLCTRLSAVYYRRHWRLDQESLPADLLRRGLAAPDPAAPHALRLIIPDYPYAADGLLIWSATRRYADRYVAAYYKGPADVRADAELQAWYREVVHVGHADKRGDPGWPPLETRDDLAGLLATIVWLASAQHAALNFGQYPLGGYVPSRPPLMRRLLPDAAADPAGYAAFVRDPQGYFLAALPGVLQATKYMAVADTLSAHSPDEEYLGERQQPDTWTADAAAREAFQEFAAEMGRVEEEIQRRNADPRLRNRCGAGVLPYELLSPSSPPGVTGRGVPNSVSI